MPVMELAFLFTPGLHLFLLQEGRGVVSADADITLFYTITVLTLFGHIPLSVLTCLLMTIREKSVEFSITVSAVIWLVLSISSIALLIAHVIMTLGFLLHTLVVMALVVGTLVRLLFLFALPYGFYHNGDCFLVFVWWWLLVGIDWPNLAVGWELFPEILSIFMAAQLTIADADTGETWFSPAGASIVAFSLPMFFRLTGLSSNFYFRLLFCILSPVYIVLSILRNGIGMDVTRVMDWTDARRKAGEFNSGNGDPELGEHGGNQTAASSAMRGIIKLPILTGHRDGKTD